MSDPRRTDPATALDDAAREARIEHLLVAGLDQYFGGHYEQAINIWTRVIFLERGHNRARAYIERARSALAERQRESEELVHGGVDAYNAGRLDAAQDLLTRAVQQGGPNETALVFLERLSRAAPPDAHSRSAWTPARSIGLGAEAVRPIPNPPGWTSTVIASVAVVSVVLIAVLGAVSWLTGVDETAAGPQQPVVMEPLPIVRSPDMSLTKARALVADGLLRDALAVLDAIGPADPVAPDADRLRGEVQRQLMEVGPVADDAAGGRR